MKINCNGYSYDTDTAKLVGSGGDADPEWSNAGWHLYETPGGAFFKVVYGHQGEEIGFALIDYQTAYKLQILFPGQWGRWGSPATKNVA